MWHTEYFLKWIILLNMKFIFFQACFHVKNKNSNNKHNRILFPGMIPKCCFIYWLKQPPQTEFISSHSAVSSLQPSLKSWSTLVVVIYGTSIVSNTAAETTKYVDKRKYLLTNLSQDISGTENIILHKYYLFYPIILDVSPWRAFKEMWQRDPAK